MPIPLGENASGETTRATPITETEYRALMARLAMAEDRLDRCSLAVGALCEVLSERLDFTEDIVFDHIRGLSDAL